MKSERNRGRSPSGETNFFKRLLVMLKPQKSRQRHGHSQSVPNTLAPPAYSSNYAASSTSLYYNRGGAMKQTSIAGRPPPEVLLAIFSYICPHALDYTYESAEDSVTETGCMLCNMRDLARVGLVCKEWHRAAQLLQYRSIRLDSVHYCGMEGELSERRKRSSFFQKQSSPLEIPEQRMRLLYRTFQESESIPALVWLLKLPYMTRETCKQDLARLVSLLPNLRYVDLPDGIYSDDSSCASLKAILYTRCSDLRKMTWMPGSEKNFVDLWYEPPWVSLEVVELSNMKIENGDLVQALSSMPYLRHLKLKDMQWATDEVFDPAFEFGQFRAIKSLELEGSTNITIDGLCTYLSRPEVQKTLESLTLTNTSIPAHLIYRILPLATSLISLSVNQTISRVIPRAEVQLLSSPTLTHLSYEIIGEDTRLTRPAPSYYAYLSESLWAGGLPSLTDLYVRETTFHKRLQNEPNGANAGVFAAGGWTQKMTVFEKDLDHMNWTKYRVGTLGNGKLLVSPIYERPTTSAFNSDFETDNRSSLLTVPGSNMGIKEKRSSRQDLWR